MSTSFDVIIAGCGPAGATAGYILARRGVNVAMLDKATFPRKKLCGGLLSWKSIQTLQRFLGLSVQDLKEAGVIDYSSDGYSIYYRDQLLFRDKAPYPFHLIDRAAFDDLLLQRARAAGAEVHLDTPVTGCNSETGVVTTAEGTSILGRWIIGADGALSIIRQAVPLDKRAWRRWMASTIEITVSRERMGRELDHPQVFAGYVKAGYCWAFPNQKNVILGICGLMKGEDNLKAHFLEFLDDFGLKDPSSIPFQGHPLPYGNFLKKPVHENVLLAGDAGGFVEPLFGEGLFYAMRTGYYAAGAVHAALTGGVDLQTAYLSPLKKHIFPELVWSNRLRWLLLHSIRIFNHHSLRHFIGGRQTQLAEMVHGMRSYRLLQRKTWD